MQQLHAVVTGRVQGVGFRQSAERLGQQLGLKGWVRNRPDGTVEVMAVGERDALDKLAKWLYEGPPGAYVIDVDVDWDITEQTFNGFTIRYGFEEE